MSISLPHTASPKPIKQDTLQLRDNWDGVMDFNFDSPLNTDDEQVIVAIVTEEVEKIWTSIYRRREN